MVAQPGASGPAAPVLRLIRGGAPARRKADPLLRTARRVVARQAVRTAPPDRRLTRLPDLPMILRPIPPGLPRLW